MEEIELDLFPFVQRLIRWRKAALKDGLYKGMKDVDTLNDQISIVCSALDQRGGGADPETAGRSNFVLEARKENQASLTLSTVLRPASERTVLMRYKRACWMVYGSCRVRSASVRLPATSWARSCTYGPTCLGLMPRLLRARR